MNRHWPYPVIVAHRGAGKLAPENTLVAINKAAMCGHRMVEFDVKLSADRVAFLLHDDTLERTTNGQGIAGHFLWSQLAQLDASVGFGSEYTSERLPLLSQVAQCCFEHQMMANIEIKPTPGTEELSGRFIAQEAAVLWDKQPAAPLLSSFSIEALAAAQQVAPHLPRGLLLEKWREDWRTITDALDCVSLHIDEHAVTKERVALVQQAGLKFFVYTVNQLSRVQELLAWGVNAIATDAIEQITPETIAASCLGAQQ